MSQHTPGPWKIVADPIHAGKHPFHDNRYIMTGDAVIENSPYVKDDWRLSKGAIICVMRDSPNNDACLIAAAPKMLERLKSVQPILKQYIEEAGPCDHAANICVCGLIHEAEQIASLIKEIEGR